MAKQLKTEIERERLDVLAALQILDSPPEPAFDQLTKLAKSLFGVPIALISLIDAERQWFKSRVGLDVDSTPRDLAFCDHAIRDDAVTIVTDARDDPRFSNNALVTGAPHIRFYAGAPIRHDSVTVGSLCVIDRMPRPDFGPEEASRLEALAAAVSSILGMRKDALPNIAVAKSRDQSKKTLELVEDIAGVGQWSYDVKSGHVKWSDQVFRIHGLPIAEHPPEYRSLLGLYVADDAAKIAALVEHSIRTGQGYTFEARLRRYDGEMRNVVAKAVCIRGQNGETETINGVFQDVTDYRVAIEQARDNEARYRLLAENIPGMLGYWDVDLKCRFANNAYIEWFGRNPEQILGIHIQTLLGDELFALNWPYIRGALAGKKQTFERAITKPGGAVGYTWAQYIPDFDDDDRVRGFYVLVTDITNVKLKELALADSNAQLLLARQQAEAALEVKAQFLATMSHEIRTPLTTIIGYANLLAGHGEMSDEAQSFVKRIGKAGQTLLGLINDVLDVSRLEAGQVTLNPRSINVRELAQNIVELFQAHAAKRNLNFRLDYDEHLPEWQMIDDTRLNQVMNNLVGNACKFTSDGAIAISMRQVESSAGARMRIEICDPGPGLTPEQTGKLFKRFQQLDAGINRKYGGSGLGLAICAEIISLMRGDIGVVSEVATGTTFWVEIPLTIAEPVKEEEASFHLPNSDAQNLHVLLVDDHSVNRQMIKALILPYAAEVTEAADGAEAIEACRASSFDLVIMDIQMPVVDGVMATKAIRASCPQNKNAPIFALTALDESQLPDGYSETLFARILAKPIDPKKFQDALSTLSAAKQEEGTS